MKTSRFARPSVGVGASVGFVTGMLTMAAIVAVVATAPEHSPLPAPAASQVLAVPVLNASAIAELRHRHLDLPVQSMTHADVRASFNEKRGADRLHEAVDILAPRNTPVLAVEDGTVAKLFFSKAGGNTVYQFDPSGNAPPNTPHLHFAIFKLTAEKQWWKGAAIDPFQVLR